MKRLGQWLSAAPAFAFATAIVIGAATALSTLSVNGLWQDELYTAWIVDPAVGFETTLSRALHDVSPPIYYVILRPISSMFGGDEVGLRLFSALSAIAAVILLIAAGARFFSLPARLFAAAMATGSVYWAWQAQNARFYAFGVLLSVGMMLLALQALKDRQRRDVLGWISAVMLVGAFTHFYLLFESLAVLALLCIYRPRDRMLLAIIGAVLLVLVVAYVELVVRSLSYAALDKNWIGNDQQWYADQIQSAIHTVLPRAGMLALAICAVIAVAMARSRTRYIDPAPVLLCLGVPVLVLMQAVASSFASAPNFYHRYVLLASPFLWGGYALLYDYGIRRSAPLLQTASGLVVASLTLWMAMNMATARHRPGGEAFRESARAIAAIDSCKGAEIPVVLGERRSWFRSPGGLEPIRAAYAKYLKGFAIPRPVFEEDLLNGQLNGLSSLIRARIDGDGCPVLAWGVHGIETEDVRALANHILQGVDRESQTNRLKLVFFQEGAYGFLILLQQGGR
jgi:hypothetical protein